MEAWCGIFLCGHCGRISCYMASFGAEWQVGRVPFRRGASDAAGAATEKTTKLGRRIGLNHVRWGWPLGSRRCPIKRGRDDSCSFIRATEAVVDSSERRVRGYGPLPIVEGGTICLQKSDLSEPIGSTDSRTKGSLNPNAGLPGSFSRILFDSGTSAGRSGSNVFWWNCQI